MAEDCRSCIALLIQIFITFFSFLIKVPFMCVVSVVASCFRFPSSDNIHELGLGVGGIAMATKMIVSMLSPCFSGRIHHTNMRHIHCFVTLVIISLFHHQILFANGSSIGGRHSYSLTTFDPSGNLDQVGRAVRASMLGAPVVALSIPSASETVVATPDSESTSPPPEEGIYMCVPLRFLGTTSPLIIDDGTPRIVPISSSICICHSGVGADGRALCDIAVRLALDHRYVYGEEISPEELLEALAEKVQEMTMKAGARPYGCALLVACLGSESVDGSDKGREATMYRIDPSGSVELLNANSDFGSNNERRSSVAFIGKWNSKKEQDIRSQLGSEQYIYEQQVQDTLIRAVEEQDDSTPTKSTSNEGEGNQTFLYASFTRKGGLLISRITRETS